MLNITQFDRYTIILFSDVIDVVKTDYECRKVASDFDPPFCIIWTVCDCQLLFQNDNPNYTANIVNAYLDRRTHNGTHHGLASPEPEPHC